jgi:hypothetical protein
VFPLQDAERCRPGSDEAPADHLCAWPREPSALPEMREGGPPPDGEPAAACAAVTSSSPGNLKICKPLFDYDQPGGHQRVVNRYVGNLAPMPGYFRTTRRRSCAAGRRAASSPRRGGECIVVEGADGCYQETGRKAACQGQACQFQGIALDGAGLRHDHRNVKSKHWTRWLGAENRCVAPFNSFSEFIKAEGHDIWFALDESRPLACFAGIWTSWTSVRTVKEGETTNDLYAFLTTEPNAEVGAIHPKAMPVILMTPEKSRPG